MNSSYIYFLISFGCLIYIIYLNKKRENKENKKDEKK